MAHGGRQTRRQRNRRERVLIKLGDRDVYTRQEAADLLGISLAKLCELISDKHGPPRLKSKKVDGRRVIMEVWLVDYMRAEGLLPADYKARGE
jgi:hypothetical protein